MSGTWASGWVAGDIVTAAEFKKGAGAIADNLLGASAANIDFTGIPSGYAHLLVVGSARCDNAASQSLLLRFNNDSGANYDYELISASAASTAAAETFAATGMRICFIPGTGATAGYFSSFLCLIPNYAGTTSDKEVFSIHSNRTGTTTGTMFLGMQAAAWRTTATAINRLTFLSAAGNLIAGSRITVYGMGA